MSYFAFLGIANSSLSPDILDIFLHSLVCPQTTRYTHHTRCKLCSSQLLSLLFKDPVRAQGKHRRHSCVWLLGRAPLVLKLLSSLRRDNRETEFFLSSCTSFTSAVLFPHIIGNIVPFVGCYHFAVLADLQARCDTARRSSEQSTRHGRINTSTTISLRSF